MGEPVGEVKGSCWAGRRGSRSSLAVELECSSWRRRSADFRASNPGNRLATKGALVAARSSTVRAEGFGR